MKNFGCGLFNKFNYFSPCYHRVHSIAWYIFLACCLSVMALTIPCFKLMLFNLTLLMKVFCRYWFLVTITVTVTTSTLIIYYATHTVYYK